MDREALTAGIVIASALFLLKLPSILRSIRIRFKTVEEMQEVAEHSFVCPCCGEVFFVNWRRLNGIKLSQLEMWGMVRIKCPKCHETDWCRWTGNDSMDGVQGRKP